MPEPSEVVVAVAKYAAIVRTMELTRRYLQVYNKEQEVLGKKMEEALRKANLKPGLYKLEHSDTVLRIDLHGDWWIDTLRPLR